MSENKQVVNVYSTDADMAESLRPHLAEMGYEGVIIILYPNIGTAIEAEGAVAAVIFVSDETMPTSPKVSFLERVAEVYHKLGKKCLVDIPASWGAHGVNTTSFSQTSRTFSREPSSIAFDLHEIIQNRPLLTPPPQPNRVQWARFEDEMWG